uniref:Uncharacterized protein n=1 Tax=Glossina pallidipes TaxID=7398 RepID=A0A1A9ZCP7_GLOPL
MIDYCKKFTCSNFGLCRHNDACLILNTREDVGRMNKRPISTKQSLVCLTEEKVVLLAEHPAIVTHAPQAATTIDSRHLHSVTGCNRLLMLLVLYSNPYNVEEDSSSNDTPLPFVSLIHPNYLTKQAYHSPILLNNSSLNNNAVVAASTLRPLLVTRFNAETLALRQIYG